MSQTTSIEEFSRLVRDVTNNIDPIYRFSNKVFIAGIANAVGKKLGINRQQFNQMLVQASRKGLIALARADLVGAMDPSMVKESEVNDNGAIFHFVVAYD